MYQKTKQNLKMNKSTHEKIAIAIEKQFKNETISLLNLIALQVGQKPSLEIFIYGTLLSVSLKNEQTVVLKLTNGLLICDPMNMRKVIQEYELRLNEIKDFEVDNLENSIFIRDIQLAECTIKVLK